MTEDPAWDYVTLGASGLKVSRIALGRMSFGVEARAWRLDEAEGRALIRQALDAGIAFFDTADMYGAGESEMVLGRAIREFVRRDELVIATKGLLSDAVRRQRPGAVAQSHLRRH